jgi:hypothetical protein
MEIAKRAVTKAQAIVAGRQPWGDAHSKLAVLSRARVKVAGRKPNPYKAPREPETQLRDKPRAPHDSHYPILVEFLVAAATCCSKGGAEPPLLLHRRMKTPPSMTGCLMPQFRPAVKPRHLSAPCFAAPERFPGSTQSLCASRPTCCIG